MESAVTLAAFGLGRCLATFLYECELFVNDSVGIITSIPEWHTVQSIRWQQFETKLVLVGLR